MISHSSLFRFGAPAPSREAVQEVVDDAFRDCLAAPLGWYIPLVIMSDPAISALIRRATDEAMAAQRFGLLDSAMVRRIVEGEFENMMVE